MGAARRVCFTCFERGRKELGSGICRITSFYDLSNRIVASFFPSPFSYFLSFLLPFFLASFLSCFLSFLIPFFLTSFLPSFFFLFIRLGSFWFLTRFTPQVIIDRPVSQAIQQLVLYNRQSLVPLIP